MIEIFLFIFGSMIGSFLNVCIYRLPRDMSVAKPARSFCPACEKQIPWYYNIPLVSWILLLGKCKFCKAKIPFRYFFVELVTALAFVGIWHLTGGNVALYVIRVIFLSMLFVIIVTDFETLLIPDWISLPGMVLGLLFSLVPDGLFHEKIWYYRLAQSVLGLVAGYGILFVTAVLGSWLFKKDAMGGGDLKLMGMMGAFIGALKVFYVFMLAPFVALPFALWYRVVKKDEQIPFGPFLAIWGAALFIYGERILIFINRIFGVY